MQSFMHHTLAHISSPPPPSHITSHRLRYICQGATGDTEPLAAISHVVHLYSAKTATDFFGFFTDVGSSLVAPTGKELSDGSAEAPLPLLLWRSRGVPVESQVDKQIIELSRKCHSNGYNIESPVVLFIVFLSINGNSQVTIKI